MRDYSLKLLVETNMYKEIKFVHVLHKLILAHLIISPLTNIGLLSFSSLIVIVTLAVEESLLGIPSSVAITSNYGEENQHEHFILNKQLQFQCLHYILKPLLCPVHQRGLVFLLCCPIRRGCS